MHVRWVEGGEKFSARWRSESGAPPPAEIVVVDDGLTADEAHRLANADKAMLWRGDFQNARQLIKAVTRRADRSGRRHAPKSPVEAFYLHRQRQARRARLLGKLLVPMETGYVVPLRRAPDVREACLAAYGPDSEPTVVSLREMLGVIGAHEWRINGVEVPGLDGRIHPHYGVFAPVRGEYVELVARAPLPSRELAFDIGTGVLAAVLAARGVESVVATDLDPRALDCARDNLDRLGFGDRVRLERTDVFPTGRAPLVVCNPPWLPAKPTSPIEHAVYDPGNRMLKAFLDRLGKHLAPGGEGWLVLSDLAEHLGLRSRDELLGAFDAAGLSIVDRLDTRPCHPRASDPDDPLHAARGVEVTSLWRLAVG
ncbi:methylase of polypeptide subunit release factors [Saccharothrix ecbatanensis]|uniref:Methylase of polypeptide subunit release factors n=1 Tax=Saccharothrix ecbatanensis TaxID=1105145 RepID=A0A7W9HIZ2_9PSEU|nr:class I SAM-dependent methyltransferase [Saccharothrix ecbatanensis]MBB5803178.1 methylase of polypeptide subunit release factors [Saccharothrix ecbatanensis]